MQHQITGVYMTHRSKIGLSLALAMVIAGGGALAEEQHEHGGGGGREADVRRSTRQSIRQSLIRAPAAISVSLNRTVGTPGPPRLIAGPISIISKRRAAFESGLIIAP